MVSEGAPSMVLVRQRRPVAASGIFRFRNIVTLPPAKCHEIKRVRWLTLVCPAFRNDWFRASERDIPSRGGPPLTVTAGSGRAIFAPADEARMAGTRPAMTDKQHLVRPHNTPLGTCPDAYGAFAHHHGERPVSVCQCFGGLLGWTAQRHLVPKLSCRTPTKDRPHEV
jgi:hypothetical protein